MTDTARETFVARFGEANAVAIEAAVTKHRAFDSDVLDIHANDDRGARPFQYDFLYAISRECVTRFASAHGITAEESDMRKWACDPDAGDLARFEGSVPDYLALICGAYDGWLVVPSEDAS